MPGEVVGIGGPPPGPCALRDPPHRRAGARGDATNPGHARRSDATASRAAASCSRARPRGRAVGPGRADRRPRLHGQHRQTSWCLLAHGQHRRRAAGEELLEHDPMRWEGVRVIGVDEHVRRRGGRPACHRHRGSGARAREARPSRARGTVPGRCEQALKTWLAGAGSAPARAGARSGGDGRDRPGTQKHGRRRGSCLFFCLCGLGVGGGPVGVGGGELGEGLFCSWW